MVDIPNEIWLQILQFIPDRELCHLMGVNRVFYELALDTRYREITIGPIDSHSVSLLKRLQDPFIACRVTKLNIIPAATAEGDAESRAPTFSSRVIETLQAIRFTIYTSIQISLNNRNIFLHTAGSPVDLAPPVVTDLIKSIFPGLTRLERLSVDFWHPPTVYDIHSVLSTAWPAIGGHLKTLFLGGNLATFRHIIATHPVLPALQELIVQLTDPFTDTLAENMDVLNNTIAPFVNSFAPTLEGFTFWSWASLDISSLFTHLGFFPMMKCIQVRLSFNKALASDPAGLAQFVQRHQNTLEELQLWLNPSGAAADHSLDLPLSQWLARTMAEVQQFPLMRELQFYPTRLEAGFDALILTITLSLETLTTLVVRDLYLSSAQVMTLLDTLGKQGPNLKLRSLRMNVFDFRAEVMDAMVAQLPALTSLNLYIGDSSTNQVTIESMMEGHVYDHWGLYNLGIWRSGQELDTDSMRAMVKSIPSIRSFHNKGHTHLLESNTHTQGFGR